MTAITGNIFENILADNLLQLRQEHIDRQRRIAMRYRMELSPSQVDWWKKPLLWGVLFLNIVIAHDVFVTSLVDWIVGTV